MEGDARRGSGGGAGSVAALVFDRDRERAFRSARRHSLLVRSLKVLLPLMALGSLGFYGAALMITSQLKGRDIAVSKVTVDPTNLRMADPRYTGFAKDGSEYRIHARSAVTDLRMAAPIRLEEIDGEFIQPTGVTTRLVATSGTYDQKQDLLELFGRIDIDATNGMRAELTRATVFTKQSRVVSNEPVVAETGTGRIRAGSMTLESKTRRAAFRDAVEVTMKPAPAPPAKMADPAQPARAAQRLGLDAGSSEPIVVRSRTLDVDDAAKTALFREAVVARQGEAQLESPELDVIYAGSAPMGEASRSAPRAGEPGTAAPVEATRLTAIRARGGVVMTSKGDRAEGQTLEYDAVADRIALAGDVVLTQAPDRRVTAEAAVLEQKSETALLTGTVVVTQGRNVMRGDRLAIDRKAGTVRLASPAAAPGAQAGRISTVLYQSARPGGATRTRPAPGAGEGEAAPGIFGAGFKADPDAPVEIDARTLDVDDRKHTAVYLGQVVARQGAFTVRSEELTAHYSGETGLLSTGQADVRERGKSGPGGSAEMRRIEARRNVVVNGSDGQQATGETATFDVKANTIVMGGNVVVSQGKQIVRAPAGMRLMIDLGSGVTRFEPEPGLAARPGAQVSGAFATSVASEPTAPAGGVIGCPPGAVCKSGRLEAIFYPNQLKDKAREKAKAKEIPKPATSATGDAAAADPKRSVPRRAARESSWEATTKAPGDQ